MNWVVKYIPLMVFSCLFIFCSTFNWFFMFISPNFRSSMLFFSFFVKVGSLKTSPWPTKPPPPGGGGLYFGDSWVVATFLKLLSSNLVCKPYLGMNFNFWSQIPQTPPPGGTPQGRGSIFWGFVGYGSFLKLLSSNLVKSNPPPTSLRGGELSQGRG